MLKNKVGNHMRDKEIKLVVQSKIQNSTEQKEKQN